MIAKRHHYVPQFYLRYFIPEKTQTFWVYDKDGRSPRQQTPVNTALKCRFYSLDAGLGNRHDVVEKMLSQIEGATKPILDRWQMAKAVPEPQKIIQVAWFLAILHMRVPRMVEAVKEIGFAYLLAEYQRLAEYPEKAAKSWQGFCGTISEAEGFTWEQFQQFIRNPLKNFRIELNEKYALGMSMRNAINIWPHLLDLNWCLCLAPEREFFVTSDAPVNVFLPEGSGARFGGGFASEAVQVAFPISPKICLFLDRKHSQKRRRVNKRKLSPLPHISRVAIIS